MARTPLCWGCAARTTRTVASSSGCQNNTGIDTAWAESGRRRARRTETDGAGALQHPTHAGHEFPDLTKKGLISPKLQLLSGHAGEKCLAMYRDLSLADVSAEYEGAMRSFPVPGLFLSAMFLLLSYFSSRR